MVARKKVILSTNGRKVVYPKFMSLDYVEGGEEGPITVEVAKAHIGWTEETEDDKFGTDYALIDHNGKKIRLLNNVRNRPLYASNYKKIEQEILNKRWERNGETIIIGRTGIVLNGQHTYVGLILAEQARTGRQSAHWSSVWDGPVTIEKVVVVGVEETDRVVNTMDTCKARSLSDVIYRSEHFAKLPAGERKVAARIADYAIRMLWSRTGAIKDPFSPKQTHTESLLFIERHPTLLECVKHVMQENKEKGISKFYSPGYAAGLMYLMACSTSDGEDYRAADLPNEDTLDWAMMPKAKEFWTLVSSNKSNTLKALKEAIGLLSNSDTLSGGNMAEKTALMVKAWYRFADGKPLREADLKLSRPLNDDGVPKLDECPDLGGIDLGNPNDSVRTDEDGEGDDTPPPASAKAPRVEPKAVPRQAAVKRSGDQEGGGDGSGLVGVVQNQPSNGAVPAAVLTPTVPRRAVPNGRLPSVAIETGRKEDVIEVSSPVPKPTKTVVAGKR